ncbi:MAG: nucleotidyltransferase domain-containing protein [Candidatus Acidiferrales bacterium]
MARSAIDGAVCDEKRLLICCARTKLAPAIAEKIRELAAQRLDWDYVLVEAAENSIGPLLDRNLRTVVSEAVPAAALESLKNAYRSNTVRCLFLTAELHRILALFRSNGILAIPYKGPVLAEQAYGDVTLRNFEDLDIILPQRDLPKAHDLILGLGYRAKYPWILSPGAARSLVPGEYNYRDAERRLMVELHTELTLRHFPVAPDLDEFGRRLATVNVGGSEVQTFAVEDLLPVLCIHGSKDFWERISWIVDISELIQKHSALDWDWVLKTTGSLRAERMLNLGLALASELLDAPLPAEILKRVRGDHDANAVAREVEGRLLGRNWPGFDAAERLAFRRRMVPGRLAGWRYSIRLAVIPAEEDWQMVRLPGPLAPLYIALRPLRLLRKYGWSAAGRNETSR